VLLERREAVNFNDLTQKNLDDFKALYPDDERVQAITLNELIEYSKGKDPTGLDATQVAGTELEGVELPGISPCQIAVGSLVIDCLLVIAGAIGIHGKVSPRAVARVGELMATEMSDVAKWANVLADSSSTFPQKAKAIFGIGRLTYTAGCLHAIVKAFLGSLTWQDMALYGCMIAPTLVAAFLTDGAALIAVIALEALQVGMVVNDAFKVSGACAV
jgi:hypothetical protein